MPRELSINQTALSNSNHENVINTVSADWPAKHFSSQRRLFSFSQDICKAFVLLLKAEETNCCLNPRLLRSNALTYSSHVIVGFTVLPNRIRSYWSSDNIEFLIIHICEAFFALNNDTFKQIMFVLWRIPICPTDDFNFLFLFMSPGWATVFKVRFTLKYLI